MADITLEVIAERLNNYIDRNSEEHEAILKQTTRTNGKVADINKWVWMITGALVFIGATLIPIITVIAEEYFSKK